MFSKKPKTESSQTLWGEAQVSAPLQMARLLSELRERNWSPSEKLEKEWFDELNNLFAPLNHDAFKKGGSDILSMIMQGENETVLHEDSNLIPIVEPAHNGSEYSMHALSKGGVLTHSPASAGLIQVWSLPHCVETRKHKLYSRRSACAISRDSSLVASKTEMGRLSIDRIADGKTLKTWSHPQEEDGSTYILEKFLDNNEVIATDNRNTLHFLSLNKSLTRTYANFLVRNKALIDCSNDGSMLITPEYGKRPYTIWKFKTALSEIEGGIRPLSDMEKLLTLGAESLPNMKARFSNDGKCLAITTPIEIQIRKFPFEEIVFQTILGRDIDQPLLAFDSESKLLAILRRSNPVELLFIDLQKGQIINRIKLAGIFSRYPISQIEFISDSQTLLLAGKERIYITNQTSKHDAVSLMRRLVNIRIKDIELEDLQTLENAYESDLMSMYLRPWAETLLYLLKRRSYDIAISEPDSDGSRYDIEIAEG